MIDVSRHIWETRYRYRDRSGAGDRTIEDSWRRVARALAAVEGAGRADWEARFLAILQDFKFLPAGRILAGAGTGRRVTLFNCFVMGAIEDSMSGIFEALKEGALTMQQGGGVGYDFSTLRPRGAAARSTGSSASGPCSFMRIWDTMCDTLISTGSRRGAMMATLRCDHPDIEAFVTAKRTAGELRHFNLSVLVFDEFMEAVERDRDWALVFPAEELAEAGAGGETIPRRWSGTARPVPCRVLRRVRARDLWERILRSTYEHAEPGVLFIDRINRLNNLGYREWITATNPCGEAPLPPYGACDLGSINLTRFVREPFTPAASLDLEGLRAVTRTAVRLLDDVIDASGFPLAAQAESARGSRRIGLGLTGLADVLILLGLRYDEPAALDLAARTMETICHGAYRASVDIAREKGSFPFFERDAHLARPFVQALPSDIRDGIARHGIRNSHLTAIAPTGTISLLANNVSGGIEPIFDLRYGRRMVEPDGSCREYALTDFAFGVWQGRGREAKTALPAPFVNARALPPEAHLAMQAALQPFVDGAVSKTINIPETFPFEEFRKVYGLAHARGLKGCTTFRPNPVTGAVLEAGEGTLAPHCCHPQREAD